MKRSPPPPRRTPLKRGKPPGAKTKRKAGAHDIDDEAVAQIMLWRYEVFRRAASKCQARCTDECGVWAQHAHHIEGRVGRSESGVELRIDPDNGLALCHHCHAWIHNHPEVAYERGWMRRRIH